MLWKKKTLKNKRKKKRDFEEAKHELNEENKAEHDSDSQQSEDNHSDDQSQIKNIGQLPDLTPRKPEQNRVFGRFLYF